MYINEQDANLSVPGIAFKNISRNVGRLGESDIEYFHGSMDDIRFHSRALSAGEIRQLYILEKPVAPPPPINEFTGNSQKIVNGSVQNRVLVYNSEPPLCNTVACW